MRIRGVGRVRRWVRRASAGMRPQVAVLLYHRVIDIARDPQCLCVSPARFAQQLERLRARFPVISLDELVRHLGSGTAPRRAVVITFDDGYLDNLSVAKPLLERFEMPATIFVASGNVGRGRGFWWDELGRLLLEIGSIPEIVKLEIAGESHEWRFPGDGQPPDSQPHHDRWSVESPENPTAVHALYRELSELLRPLAPAVRDGLLQQLACQMGHAEMPGSAEDRCVTPTELLRLDDGDLVKIGAHTRRHPMLSALSVDEQQCEIETSKHDLETMLGRKVEHFSYPFGGRSHYSPETVELVRGAGFQCACSNFPGTVEHGTDCFQLPRFLVRNWTADELESRLYHWFRG